MNLVVQGPALAKGDLEALSLLVKPSRGQEIAPHAFRFFKAMKNEGVAALCQARRIDHAWIPEGRRFADLRLLAMDMDSTLITIECVDELGALAGKGREIAAITEQAMRGEIADYKESLRRRVALLAGLPEASLLTVYEQRLKLTPGAETLIRRCKEAGVKLLLVTGGFTFFTERLKARLGLDYTASNVLEVKGGRLTGALLGDILDAEGKAAKFREVMSSLGAEKENTIAIGDGANDLKMMQEAGVSVAFRAKPVVQAQATCALNWSGLDAVVNLFE
jgi:phosphoserine phosphatase